MAAWFRKKPSSYFSEAEKLQIRDAVQAAEKQTSGEIRVFVESHCEYIDPVRRAKELFLQLSMQQTAERNGVLLYIAMKDRQLAVYGDEGIHQKVGSAFWNRQVQDMLQHFNRQNYVAGISNIIHAIGEALRSHFPYNAETDTNELPDDMVFGS
jgi:uncharacterized membrane protein